MTGDAMTAELMAKVARTMVLKNCILRLLLKESLELVMGLKSVWKDES